VWLTRSVDVVLTSYRTSQNNKSAGRHLDDLAAYFQRLQVRSCRLICLQEYTQMMEVDSILLYAIAVYAN